MQYKMLQYCLAEEQCGTVKYVNYSLSSPTKADFIRAKHQLLSYVLRSSDTEEELNQQLHSSVRTGNLETSLRLLAQGADPNYYHEVTTSSNWASSTMQTANFRLQ